MIRPRLSPRHAGAAFALLFALGSFGAGAGAAQAASGCGHLTANFQICLDGTPYVTGHWEAQGDTDILWYDKVEHTAFEDYLGHDPKIGIKAEMTSVLEAWSDTLVEIHKADSFSVNSMLVERRILSRTLDTGRKQTEAVMIAEGPTGRLMMRVVLPKGTAAAKSLKRLENMSQTYAGLVRPKRGAN